MIERTTVSSSSLSVIMHIYLEMPLRASCLGSVFPISKSQMAFTGYLLHIKKRYCGESRLDFDFFFNFFGLALSLNLKS